MNRDDPPHTIRIHMKLRRESTQVIWRTVVVAGAMLGAPACKKDKPADTTPTVTEPNPCAANADPNPCAANPCAPNPCATDNPCGESNPCGDRIRGGDDEGGVGRGFILS